MLAPDVTRRSSMILVWDVWYWRLLESLVLSSRSCTTASLRLGAHPHDWLCTSVAKPVPLFGIAWCQAVVVRRTASCWSPAPKKRLRTMIRSGGLPWHLCLAWRLCNLRFGSLPGMSLPESGQPTQVQSNSEHVKFQSQWTKWYLDFFNGNWASTVYRRKGFSLWTLLFLSIMYEIKEDFMVNNLII